MKGAYKFFAFVSVCLFTFMLGTANVWAGCTKLTNPNCSSGGADSGNSDDKSGSSQSGSVSSTTATIPTKLTLPVPTNSVSVAAPADAIKPAAYQHGVAADLSSTSACVVLDATGACAGIRKAAGHTTAVAPIDVFNTCKYIDNTGSNDILIPYGNALDWQNFLQNHPSYISITDCTLPSSRGSSLSGATNVTATVAAPSYQGCGQTAAQTVAMPDYYGRLKASSTAAAAKIPTGQGPQLASNFTCYGEATAIQTSLSWVPAAQTSNNSLNWQPVPIYGPDTTMTASAGTQVGLTSITVIEGTALTLSWSNGSTEGVSCSATSPANWTTSTNPVDTATVTPSLTTTAYTITCTGSNGLSSAATVNVSVTPKAPTVTLTASTTNITVGQQVILNWTTTNATSCALSSTDKNYNNSTVQTQSGSVGLTVYPQTTNTYTLACTGQGGSASQNVTVNINACVAKAAVTTDYIAPTQDIVIDQDGVLNYTLVGGGGGEAYGSGGGGGGSSAILINGDLAAYAAGGKGADAQCHNGSCSWQMVPGANGAVQTGVLNVHAKDKVTVLVGGGGGAGAANNICGSVEVQSNSQSINGTSSFICGVAGGGGGAGYAGGGGGGSSMHGSGGGGGSDVGGAGGGSYGAVEDYYIIQNSTVCNHGPFNQNAFISCHVYIGYSDGQAGGKSLAELWGGLGGSGGGAYVDHAALNLAMALGGGQASVDMPGWGWTGNDTIDRALGYWTWPLPSQWKVPVIGAAGGFSTTGGASSWDATTLWFPHGGAGGGAQGGDGGRSFGGGLHNSTSVLPGYGAGLGYKIDYGEGASANDGLGGSSGEYTGNNTQGGHGGKVSISYAGSCPVVSPPSPPPAPACVAWGW